MPTQKGGGSVGQSLRYLDTSAPEQTAAAGSDLLVQRGLIARPAIGGSKVTTDQRGGGTRKNKQGGFYPSVMKGVLNAGMFTAPLVALTARRMMSRKGGGKKGEIWKHNKNEAKAILEHYGKPSAGNVQAFAIARRRGTDPSEQYIEDFKKRKQEKAEKNEAAKQAKLKAKLEKKASRNAAREQSKQNKAAAKAAAKAAKAATKKNKPVKVAKAKGTKKVKVAAVNENAEYRTFWQSLFGNNAATPKAATPKAATPKAATPKAATPKAATPKAAKTRKSPSAKSKQYFDNLRNARAYLGTIGAPQGPNMSAYVKAKRAGDEEALRSWVENFKTRRPATMAATKKAAKVKKTNVAAAVMEVPKTAKTVAAPKTAKAKKPNTTAGKTTLKKAKTVAPTATAVAAKTGKPASVKSQQYFQNLKNARAYLGTIGVPQGPNMSAYVKAKRTGDEATLRSWVENFKTRRPLTMATAKKAAKPKTKAAPKALTAVKEENEENEMQGYSENFEPEEE
jgi:hypothetical protein